jgi:PAS domain S-box-containing protein
VVGQSVETIIPPRLRAAHLKGMERYLLTGEAHVVGKPNVEVPARKKDGSEFPMHISVSEMQVEGSRTFVGIVRDMLFSIEVLELNGQRHLLTSFHDITERKLAEIRLKQSETRFSKVFNLSPVAITLTNMADGRYLNANEAFLKMLGYQQDEIIGATALERNIWTTPEARSAMLERIQRHGSVSNEELQVRCKSGALLDVMISVDVIELIDGAPYLLFLYTDITQRKRAQQALLESEEKFRSRWPDAGNGRISSHQGNPAARAIDRQAYPDHCGNRTRDEGRPEPVPGCGDG